MIRSQISAVIARETIRQNESNMGVPKLRATAPNGEMTSVQEVLRTIIHDINRDSVDFDYTYIKAAGSPTSFASQQ